MKENSSKNYSKHNLLESLSTKTAQIDSRSFAASKVFPTEMRDVSSKDEKAKVAMDNAAGSLETTFAGEMSAKQARMNHIYTHRHMYVQTKLKKNIYI